MNSPFLFWLCRLSEPPVREVAARGLRYLERLGAIRLEPRRRVTILDRHQLASIAGNPTQRMGASRPLDGPPSAAHSGRSPMRASVAMTRRGSPRSLHSTPF